MLYPYSSGESRTHPIVYRSLNGSPSDNMKKVIELTGGIERIAGHDDIVIIKPNFQWWNQGSPNLFALETLVDIIMGHPAGFRGEVVIAENCHRGNTPWTSASSGWAARYHINADSEKYTNANELAAHLKQRYGSRLTICHWLDVQNGNKRVHGPADGPGYVYCDGTGGVPLISMHNKCVGAGSRTVIMTYPIFATDTGKLVDLKNGVWDGRSYTRQKVRFINLAALNYHSTYCGMTSSVKNYLGVSDLSGGADPSADGRLTGRHYNFHSFPFDKWAHGPRKGMLGAEIGKYLSTIRQADMNIITAEWVGICSRTEPPAAHTKTILASTDPVALDYHAAKYVLYPNSHIQLHNPDNKKGPLYHDLKNCASQCGGIMQDDRIRVVNFDFRQKMPKNRKLPITGDIVWGNQFKQILKYLYLRVCYF